MALLKKTQRSFSGGQLDKDLMGRQDLAKYSQGCLVLENFKVRKQGNVVKRSGTDLICDITRIRFTLEMGEVAGAANYNYSAVINQTPVTAAKLVPIIQERESGLYILLTGGRAYLVSPDGAKMNDGTWSRAPYFGLTDDQLSAEPQNPLINGEIDDIPTPYSIEVPFADEDLAMLDWCQSGDTIFFAHRSYPPCKLLYSGGTLEYEQIQFRQGRGTPPAILSLEKLGTWNGTANAARVEYAVTAVKDGVETGMSVPFATEYNMPWGTGNSIRINIDTSGLVPGSWDCFYVYKKEADVFGLIGTTSNQTSFVDVSSGFSVSGDLYPDDYTQFDKTVHLRDGGNRFASVHRIDKVVRTTTSGVAVANNNVQQHRPYAKQGPEGFNAWMRGLSKAKVTSTTPDPTYSKTAQKFCSDVDDNVENHPTVVVFTLGDDGFAMSGFTMRTGSLEHRLRKEVDNFATATYWYMPNGANYLYTTTPVSTEVTSTLTKWVGVESYFRRSSATWHSAKVEYWNPSANNNAGAWQWSAEFDCPYEMSQLNLANDWEPASGEIPNLYKRTYAESDHMTSSTDATTVLARMDAYAPAVGASVEFSLPSAVAGKKVRKIKVYGWDSQEKNFGTPMIVNGISCHQTGAYVNSFTDTYITPDLTITPPKSEDHFVNPGEYPGCVQIYSQRLVYAASAMEPFKFWMSCTGDLYNFDVHEYLRASDAISASTAALEMPRINRMLVHRDLMLFADGGEWQVAPSSGNAVAPSTIAAKLQSVIGCAAWIKPIPIESDIIFCDGSGESLMATRYNFASDGYESSNLSVLSQRLFRNNPIRAMAYVQFPESTIECVLADGTIASLVYMKEHDVCAWSHHTLGGGWSARDVAANKSVVAGSSHCAFVASRPDGKWGILSLRDIDPNDKTLLGNLRMDAVRTVNVARSSGQTEPGNAPETADGETAVRVGELRETATTDVETPTDPDEPVVQQTTTTVTHDVWAVGCLFKSVIKTTSPEFTEQETAQMEVKNATESEVRVIDGSDFTVRQPEVPPAKATRMKVPSPVDATAEDFTVEPGDADCRLPLVGTNSRNGSIILEHDGYLPLAVLSVTTSYRVEYANHANGGSGDE